MTKKKIGYLGPIGTYTGLAVNALFPDSNAFDLKEFSNIQNCLLAANQEETNFTVVPIENSIGGSVNMTLDWLIHEIKVPIQGEVHLPIHHELLANPSQVQNKDHHLIYGHPQALKQCEKFLREYYSHIEIRPTNSSAEAAKIVSNNPKKPWLAIANSIAKEIYGLVDLEKNIEDNAANMTRFIVLGREKLSLTADKMKSSLIVSFPENNIMMLYEVLGLFDKWKIYPTKIDSAPMKTELGEYVFFIDVDTTDKQDNYNSACADMLDLNCTLRHLGTYPTLATVTEPSMK